MTRRTKKIIGFGILIAVAAGALTAYLMWNKPHRNVKDADAIKVTAVDLYNSFITDSAKARTTYVTKIVEASGEVIKTASNQQQQVIVMLKTGTGDGFINCTMEGAAENIKTGDKIALKGECSGYNGDAEMGIAGDVILVRCYLVK